MAKVRILRMQVGADSVWKVGQVVELTDTQAEYMVEKGKGELVEETPRAPQIPSQAPKRGRPKKAVQSYTESGGSRTTQE